MKMTKKKRFLAWMLSVVMTIGLIPVHTFATSDAVSIGTKEEFLNAAKNPLVKTINITTDIDMTDAGVIDVSGKTVDLGGNTILAKNFTLIFQGSDFTIRNGKFDSKRGSYAMFIGENPTENVLIENVETKGGINVYNSTNVVLRDVDVKCLGIPGYDYYAVWCDQGGKVIVESGTFEATSETIAVLGMNKKGTALDVNGGTFIANGKPLVLESKGEDNQDKYNKPVIHGGSYDCSAKEYLDESLKYEVSTAGEYRYFKTVEEAVENSTSDSVIIPADSEVNPDTAKTATLLFNDGTNKTRKLLADVDGKITLPEASREGYAYGFVGWENESGMYKANETITLTEDQTFTAKWKLYVKKYTAKKLPSCTEPGNIEYWYVPELDMYFKDEALTQKITLKDTVLAATGHQYKEGKCVKCGTADPDYVKNPAVVVVKDAKTNGVYTITETAEDKVAEVEYSRPMRKKVNVVIPATVLFNGKKYQVTSIGRKAFRENKKVRKIVVPKSVEKIGNGAFRECKNLKTLTIKTKKLTNKALGINVFKWINPRVSIRVPRAKVKEYQRIFEKHQLKGIKIRGVNFVK